MTDTVQHGHFGEKSGGAKRGLWRQRGLLPNNLSAMNERETGQYIKKDNA